jgi:hypothetical protein
MEYQPAKVFAALGLNSFIYLIKQTFFLISKALKVLAIFRSIASGGFAGALHPATKRLSM